MMPTKNRAKMSPPRPKSPPMKRKSAVSNASSIAVLNWLITDILAQRKRMICTFKKLAVGGFSRKQVSIGYLKCERKWLSKEGDGGLIGIFARARICGAFPNGEGKIALTPVFHDFFRIVWQALFWRSLQSIEMDDYLPVLGIFCEPMEFRHLFSKMIACITGNLLEDFVKICEMKGGRELRLRGCIGS